MSNKDRDIAAPGEAIGRGEDDASKFIPFVSVERQAGVTVALFEDVANIAMPLHPGIHHFVDELRAMDDDRLVGVQIWTCEPFRVLSTADREAIRETFLEARTLIREMLRGDTLTDELVERRLAKITAALALIGEG